MVEVVLALHCKVVLLLAEDFVERVHGQEGDPRHAELLDDGVGHGGLSASATPADANEEGLDQLALTVVPVGGDQKEPLKGKYHLTIDLLFDRFRNACLCLVH